MPQASNSGASENRAGTDPRNSQAPTILDVAKLAGVGKSSVSRVLNAPKTSRSPHARRILEAAEELGYRRDALASGLRRGQTDTIGVIVPRLTDPAMALFYQEISRLCLQENRIALVATSGTEIAHADAEQAARTLIDRRVDGIIITTDRAGDPTTSVLRNLGIPHVCALRSEGTSPTVLADDVSGAYQATTHLLELGHRQIALVNGPTFTSNSRGRLEGFLQAHHEAGIEIDPRRITDTDFTVESAVDSAHRLLDEGVPFTACVAATDNIAIGVTSALKSRGLEVPRDVSITGFNDIPIAQHLPVPLTTVNVPYGELAAKSLDLLTTSTGDPTLIVPTSLVVRKSTRPATT